MEGFGWRNGGSDEVVGDVMLLESVCFKGRGVYFVKILMHGVVVKQERLFVVEGR